VCSDLALVTVGPPAFLFFAFLILIFCSALRLGLAASFCTSGSHQFSQMDLVNDASFDTYIVSDKCTTVTSTTATTTTGTETSTTLGCVDSLYQGPIGQQRGTVEFRIAFDDGVPVEQCLAGCTATANCAGISHDVGRTIFSFGAEVYYLSGIFSLVL
jgi:hypothetical protein